MAPKRKADPATKAGGKKVKEGSSTPKDPFRTAKETLMAAGPQEKSQRKADIHFEREHMSAQVSPLVHNIPVKINHSINQ